MTDHHSKTQNRAGGRLRQRVAVALLLLLLGVILATAAGHAVLWQLASVARQAIEEDAAQSSAAYEVALRAAKCRQAELEFELGWNDEDARQHAVLAWQAAYCQLQEAIDLAVSLRGSGPGGEKFARWHHQSTSYQEQFRRVVGQVEQGSLADAVAVHAATHPGKASLDSLTEEANRAATFRTNAALAQTNKLDSLTARRIRLINVRGVFASLTLLLVALWFSRRVLVRIGALSEAVHRLRCGDWTVRLDCDGDDELDRLGQELGEMTAAIRTDHEELRTAKQQAESASRAKSEFLARIAGKIRGPIRASLDQAQTLCDHLADPHEHQTAAAIQRTNEYLLEVVDDLRDLARIEAGRFCTDPVLCSPYQITAEVTATARDRADAKGVSLAIEFEGQVPEQIRTDPARLQQVLANLVDNAVKFSEHGTVRLVTRLVEEPDSQPRLQIEVIDEGIGMSRQKIARLFQPLTRENAPGKGELPATGLGLTLSKQLVDKLGGTIDVHSTPGAGSAFAVTIPTGIEPRENQTGQSSRAGDKDLPPDPAPPAPQPQPTCRVLLAEDGRENSRLLSFLLKKAGADAVVVDNGQQALDTVLAAEQNADSGETFDVILMDMQMPVLDGYDATRRLRQHGYRGTIIAVTGCSHDYDRQKCLDAGCDDYVAKPISREKILEIVARYTRQPA